MINIMQDITNPQRYTLEGWCDERVLPEKKDLLFDMITV